LNDFSPCFVTRQFRLVSLPHSAAREDGVRKCPAFAVGYPQYFIRGSSAPKCRRNTANANIASRQIALLATTFSRKKDIEFTGFDKRSRNIPA
jgi:hypothetical protein